MSVYKDLLLLVIDEFFRVSYVCIDKAGRMTKLIGKGQAMAGKIDYQVRVQVFNMIYEDYRESIER